MKVLLLLLLASSLNAKLMYSPEKQMYYSTNLTSEHNAEKYHTLAKNATLLIDVAYYEDIDIKSMISSIKNTLLVDGSPESDLLYDDIVEVWG